MHPTSTDCSADKITNRDAPCYAFSRAPRWPRVSIRRDPTCQLGRGARHLDPLIRMDGEIEMRVTRPRYVTTRVVFVTPL